VRKVLDVGTELTGRMANRTSQDFDPSKEPVDGEEELDTKKKTKRTRSMDVPPRLKHILGARNTALGEELEVEDPLHERANEQEESDKKSKIDAIWAQLNARTNPTPTTASTQGNTNGPTTKSISTAGETQKQGREGGSREKADMKAAAKEALQALKQQEEGLAPGQIYVKDVRRFAGQKVELQKAVEGAPENADEGLKKRRKTSNLGSIIEQLGSGKKISVVDKSRYDWQGYKKDEKLDEELETYKKSSNKYLDKVHFLKQAEYKEYERERDQRLNSDVRNRGRL